MYVVLLHLCYGITIKMYQALLHGVGCPEKNCL